jgi:hypothetical protein
MPEPMGVASPQRDDDVTQGPERQKPSKFILQEQSVEKTLTKSKKNYLCSLELSMLYLTEK